MLLCNVLRLNLFAYMIRSILDRSTFISEACLQDIENRLQVVQGKVVGNPCGGFSTAYRCMCEYYSLPVIEEVTWVSVL